MKSKYLPVALFVIAGLAVLLVPLPAAVKDLLARHPGGCALTVRAVIPGETETTISPPQRVAPSDELIEVARRLGFEVELR